MISIRLADLPRNALQHSVVLQELQNEDTSLETLQIPLLHSESDAFQHCNLEFHPSVPWRENLEAWMAGNPSLLDTNTISILFFLGLENYNGGFMTWLRLQGHASDWKAAHACGLVDSDLIRTYEDARVWLAQEQAARQRHKPSDTALSAYERVRLVAEESAFRPVYEHGLFCLIKHWSCFHLEDLVGFARFGHVDVLQHLERLGALRALQGLPSLPGDATFWTCYHRDMTRSLTLPSDLSGYIYDIQRSDVDIEGMYVSFAARAVTRNLETLSSPQYHQTPVEEELRFRDPVSQQEEGGEDEDEDGSASVGQQDDETAAVAPTVCSCSVCALREAFAPIDPALEVVFSAVLSGHVEAFRFFESSLHAFQAVAVFLLYKASCWSGNPEMMFEVARALRVHGQASLHFRTLAIESVEQARLLMRIETYVVDMDDNSMPPALQAALSSALSVRLAAQPAPHLPRFLFSYLRFGNVTPLLRYVRGLSVVMDPAVFSFYLNHLAWLSMCSDQPGLFRCLCDEYHQQVNPMLHSYYVLQFKDGEDADPIWMPWMVQWSFALGHERAFTRLQHLLQERFQGEWVSECMTLLGVDSENPLVSPSLRLSTLYFELLGQHVAKNRWSVVMAYLERLAAFPSALKTSRRLDDWNLLHEVYSRYPRMDDLYVHQRLNERAPSLLRDLWAQKVWMQYGTCRFEWDIWLNVRHLSKEGFEVLASEMRERTLWSLRQNVGTVLNALSTMSSRTRDSIVEWMLTNCAAADWHELARDEFALIFFYREDVCLRLFEAHGLLAVAPDARTLWERLLAVQFGESTLDWFLEHTRNSIPGSQFDFAKLHRIARASGQQANARWLDTHHGELLSP